MKNECFKKNLHENGLSVQNKTIYDAKEAM
jgi:hypothetical protein